ncbi:MAG: hypothetical protein K6C12_15255 [Oscillospiraceae bacterium]|nr:hypothetical protein [Oscillospiraceae bacterium]
MKNKKRTGREFTILTLVLVCSLLLSACGSDPYTEYASAYNKLTANGGIDANIKAKLVMDGETQNYAGNFKVDNTKNIIYYEMSAMEGKTIQFSDGTYIYTIQGDHKTKYKLNQDESEAAPEEGPEQNGENREAPEFDTSSFISDFASVLEVSKIKELELLSPIPKAAVIKTTKNGDVYTLQVADSVVQRFLNTMATEQSGTDDTVQLSDLKNFTYTATVKNGVVTANTYSGDVTVKIPASLMSNGVAKDLTLNFTINVDFVNPGKAVSVNLPSTDGFEEIKELMSAMQ